MKRTVPVSVFKSIERSGLTATAYFERLNKLADISLKNGIPDLVASFEYVESDGLYEFALLTHAGIRRPSEFLRAIMKVVAFFKPMGRTAVILRKIEEVRTEVLRGRFPENSKERLVKIKHHKSQARG
jgi:hypothetical protein